MDRKASRNRFSHRVAAIAAAFAATACGGSPDTGPGTTASGSAATPSGSVSRGASDSASASVTLAAQTIAATEPASVAWIARSGQNVTASASAQVSIGQGQQTFMATGFMQGGTPFAVAQGSRIGQSFVTQRAGRISGAELYIKSCRGSNPDLMFEVRKGSDIESIVVAIGVVAGNSIPPHGSGDCVPVPVSMHFIDARLQQISIAVEAGETYSIWPVENNGKVYTWTGGSVYPEGTFSKRDSSGEIVSGSGIDISIRAVAISPEL